MAVACLPSSLFLRLPHECPLHSPFVDAGLKRLENEVAGLSAWPRSPVGTGSRRRKRINELFLLLFFFTPVSHIFRLNWTPLAHAAAATAAALKSSHLHR
jgi:hypothetical protein